MTALVHTRADLAEARAALPGRVAVVPTMGALHDGHRANFKRRQGDRRFGDRHGVRGPARSSARTRIWTSTRGRSTRDLAMCEDEGIDLVFAPTRQRDVPGRSATGSPLSTLDPLARFSRARSRPGYFTGVLTVVSKLLPPHPKPDAACFGEKDFQRLAIGPRGWSATSTLGVDVVAVETNRERGRARPLEPQRLPLRGPNALRPLPSRRAAGRAAQTRREPACRGSERLLRAESGRRARAWKWTTWRGQGQRPRRGSRTGAAARLLIAAKAGTTRLIDNAARRQIGDAR